MESDSVAKEFEKKSEVLPIQSYGLSTVQQFKKVEAEQQHIDWLKQAGLSEEELKLYSDNEAGVLNQAFKMESTICSNKLKIIYDKINEYRRNDSSNLSDELQNKAKVLIESSTANSEKSFITFYPVGHPMNDIKQLEEDLFGHLKDKTVSITKRRKELRRLERNKQRILSQDHHTPTQGSSVSTPKPGSLWDVKELPLKKIRYVKEVKRLPVNKRIIGPIQKTMYTIKDNKIVRLEHTDKQNNEYKAVDIVYPVNSAEERLLEGTKMELDDIKKINRFKNYEPGSPSKVLYIKNIATSVNQEQVAKLFNQFTAENGAPLDVRLMSGRMRGQAFVEFKNEDLAIRALNELNGTILQGKPIVIQFGRNSNRIQLEEKI